METITDNIIRHLSQINWEGPAAFVVALLALFAFLRKYSLVLLIILTIVLAWGAENIILLNMTTQNEVITLPFLIYVVGGSIVFIAALFSFFKAK